MLFRSVTPHLFVVQVLVTNLFEVEELSVWVTVEQLLMVSKSCL